MSTLQKPTQAQAPAKAKERRACGVPAGKGASQHNPLWQSLAQRPVAIQPKLNVRQPEDPQEQEADQVADQVMRMATAPVGDSNLSFSSAAALKVQRKCDECEEEEEKPLQRKAQGGDAGSAVADSSMVQQTLRTPGQPLDAGTRAFMEPRFNHDFSRVRVHTDASAAESAQTVNALAYTVGNRIVFGPGKYRPQTNEGRRLLAHELTHVVQQGGDSLNGRGGGRDAASSQGHLQRKIIVDGKDYTPTAQYLQWLEKNYGKAMVEFITDMHNGGKPPDFKFSSFEQMGTEVKVRSQIIKGIEEVHKGCCSYPNVSTTGQLDPKFWDKVGPFQFKVKTALPAGKNASDAIEAIFKNGAGSELECNSTAVAIQYRAMLKTLGTDHFNKKFPGGAGIIISPHHTPPAGVGLHPIWEKGLYKTVSITGVGDLMPGDWVYFKNIPDYISKHPGGLWTGEHCLYLGNNKFRGFGVSELDEGQLKAKLLDAYNTGILLSDQKKLSDVPGLQDYARRPVIEEITK